MKVISHLLNAVLQVVVFACIPYVVFRLTHRDRGRSFRSYIGLIPANSRSLWLAAGVTVVMSALNLAVLAAAGLLDVAVSPATVAGGLRAQGFSVTALLQLLIYAGIQTSLSEEIFFRGFVAKRLVAWLGFPAGNLIQAVLFGSLHLVLFMAIGGPLSAVSILFLLLSPSMSGWLLGYIKERTANGSILPGWLAHGLANLIAFGYLAFLL